VEPSAIEQPGPELKHLNAHIAKDRESAITYRAYGMKLQLLLGFLI